jgi:hypothetical protein
MKYPDNIERTIRKFCSSRKSAVKTTTELDKRIIDDVLLAQENLKKTQSAVPQSNIWRIIMKSNVSKLAAVIIIIGVVLCYFAFEKLGSTAWALEETIEALRNFNAIHMIGAFNDEGSSEQGCEIWMKANKSQTRSEDIVIKINSGVIHWVEDGSTYVYVPQENKVYYEDAITAGMAQWPGPILFETLANAQDCKIIRGRDPATSRERATLLCSLFSVVGPQSWMIEFDVKTKLPVAISTWNNLDRRGKPFFKAWKITYYEDIPDSVFQVAFPEGTQLVEKPLIIPESSLGLLSNPQSGISTEGLSREEACRMILRQMYEAIVAEDLDELKRLCPACATWGDDLLEYVVLGKPDEERVAEIVEIRPICKEGHTKLGPVVVVPWILKSRNGAMREDKQIIQFREIKGQPSCVIHGPYGLPREIE